MTITKEELYQLITLINMDISALENYIDRVNNRWDTEREKIKLNNYNNLMNKLENEYYSNKKEIVINVENK